MLAILIIAVLCLPLILTICPCVLSSRISKELDRMDEITVYNDSENLGSF